MMADDDVASATGLALAALVRLVERSGAAPPGEAARCLALLAEAAPPGRPRQREILEDWARLLATRRAAIDG
jgi:hypothetical protein